MERKLLPSLVCDGNPKVEYFDAVIYGAFIRDDYKNDNTVLTIVCQRVTYDDGTLDEKGVIVHNFETNDYRIFSIPMGGEREGILYSQLITTVFPNGDMPIEDFSPYILQGNLVRIVSVKDSRKRALRP